VTHTFKHLHCSSEVIYLIKLRRIRWAGHVALKGKRGVYRVLMQEPEGRNHFQDHGVDGLKILKWMFKK
jgi:hypothetical protein